MCAFLFLNDWTPIVYWAHVGLCMCVCVAIRVFFAVTLRRKMELEVKEVKARLSIYHTVSEQFTQKRKTKSWAFTQWRNRRRELLRLIFSLRFSLFCLCLKSNCVPSIWTINTRRSYVQRESLQDWSWKKEKCTRTLREAGRHRATLH